MIEPKIHSNITRRLPDGHWLLGAVPDDVWACQRCYFVIYRRETAVSRTDQTETPQGTLVTWVEHGLVAGGTKDLPTYKPYLLCLFCFFAYFTTWPIMARWWFLDDFGGPQEARYDEWIAEALVEREHTGVDLLRDPPKEMEGYERLPLPEVLPTVRTIPTPTTEAELDLNAVFPYGDYDGPDITAPTDPDPEE